MKRKFASSAGPCASPESCPSADAWASPAPCAPACASSGSSPGPSWPPWMACVGTWSKRGPTSTAKMNPARGSAGMRAISSSIGSRLLLEVGVLVDLGGLASPDDGDDQREPDGDLGSRHGHDHEREHRAGVRVGREERV